MRYLEAGAPQWEEGLQPNPIPHTFCPVPARDIRRQQTGLLTSTLLLERETPFLQLQREHLLIKSLDLTCQILAAFPKLLPCSSSQTNSHQGKWSAVVGWHLGGAPCLSSKPSADVIQLPQIQSWPSAVTDSIQASWATWLMTPWWSVMSPPSLLPTEEQHELRDVLTYPQITARKSRASLVVAAKESRDASGAI